MIRLTLKRDQWTPRLMKILGGLDADGRRRVNAAIGDEFKNVTAEQFGQNQPNRPAPWAQYSERYARQKGYRTPDLILSGGLQHSFSVNAGENSVVVSANRPHAAAQQFGRPEANLPARPFFPVIAGQLTEYATKRIVNRVGMVLKRLFHG